MIIKNGKTTSALYKGTKEIVKRYKGTLLVYEAFKKLIASGVPPITLQKCKGANLVDYKIYGDSVQNGTPTPNTPIEIQSVGDKTKNLFENKNDNISSSGVYKGLDMRNWEKGAYTLQLKLKDGKQIPQGVYFGFLYAETSAFWLIQNGGINPLYKNLIVSANVNNLNGVTCYPSNKTDALIDAFDIFLVKGDYNINNVPLYEPYGYKIPVKVSGKNLFDGELEIGYIDTETGANNTYGYQEYYRSKNYIEIDSSIKKIVFSSDANSKRISLCCYDENYNYLGYYYKNLEIDGNRTFYVTNVLNNTKYVRFSVMTKNNPAIIENLPIQLEKGNILTVYEPYFEPITTNIYLNEPLRKIGDYADYIDFESGKIVRNIAYKEITSSSITAKSSSSTDDYNYYFITFSKAKVGGGVPILSNIGGGTHNAFAQRNKEGIFTNSNTTFFIAFFDIKTLADAKQFVTDNYVYANYILETPTEQTIELPNIPTIKGTTIIEVDTNILPSNMEIKYYGKTNILLLNEEENIILNSIINDNTETELDITDTEINQILDEIIGG